MNEKFQKGLICVFIMVLIIPIIAVVKISVDREQQWQVAESKTYQPTDEIDIYVVSNKKDIDSIVLGDYHSAEKGNVYINLRKNIYTTGFKDIVSALINLDKAYVVKKEGDKISVAELYEDNVYDKRKNKTKPFTVTIKKLDDDFRVIIENKVEEKPSPKEVTYTSDGLP